MTLEERLAAVEATLKAMTTEVRTQRLVVVDASGHERVEAYAENGNGGVRVNSRAVFGEPTTIELFANEESDDPSIGLSLSALGNIVGLFALTDAGRAELWARQKGVGDVYWPAGR